jgi:hypothetical protein
VDPCFGRVAELRLAFWNGPSRLSAKMRPALAWEIRLLGDQLVRVLYPSYSRSPVAGTLAEPGAPRSSMGLIDLKRTHLGG